MTAAVVLGVGACGSSGRPPAASTSPAAQLAQDAPPPHQPVTSARARPTGRVISVRTSPYGRILSDGARRTIYLFTRDNSPASTCYGACAAAWPPVLTKGAPRTTGALSAALGTRRRRDGGVQVTYAGHPLYYYVGDVKPGEILCQNVEEFGGTWLVVSRGGAAVR